jgi:hypothetical protein
LHPIFGKGWCRDQKRAQKKPFLHGGQTRWNKNRPIVAEGGANRISRPALGPAAFGAQRDVEPTLAGALQRAPGFRSAGDEGKQNLAH